MKTKLINISLIILSLTLFLCASLVNGVTNYVWQGSPSPTSPYTNWSTAAHIIQDAVDAANNGGLVLVTNGFYLISSEISVTNQIEIKSLNGALDTTVYGSGSHRCFNLSGPCILEGFTVTHGYSANGAGIYCSDNVSTVQNCRIVGNTGYNFEISFGGGIYRGTVINSLIARNSVKADSDWFSLAEGGGAYESRLFNCTITRNSAEAPESTHGYESRYGGVDYCTAFNSIIYNNEPSEKCCDFYYCYFDNPYFTDAASDNYHLLNNSPCVNSGTNMPYVFTTKDLDGENRLVGQNVDIGCYELGKLNCSLRGSPVSGLSPLTVNFKAFPYGTNTEHLSFYWDFNDDGTNDYVCENITTAFYVYTTDGKYSVSLIVSNDVGESATMLENNYITVNSPIIANFYARPLTGNAPLTVQFYDSSENAPLSWSWDINGDGIIDSNSQNPIFTYSNTGTYTITLSVANSYSSDTISKTNYIVVTGDSYPYRYASLTGSNIYPYTSWETAANSIQSAVNSANKYDTVLVTNGIYLLNSQIYLSKTVLLKSVNGSKKTIINGNKKGRCLLLTESSCANGFTFTNGYALTSSHYFPVYGGGVYCNSGSTVINCRIIYNTVENLSTPNAFGGGVFGGVIINSLIAHNYAVGYWDHTVDLTLGGAAYNSKLINCTVVNNSVCDEFSNHGGVSHCSLFNSVVISNYIAYPGRPSNYGASTFDFCCTQPLPTAEGNISNNPMFEYASTGNYHLAFGSLCIDAGTNAYVVGDWDLDGNPRIVGGRVDMGCYEALIPEPFSIIVLIGIISLFILRKFSHEDAKIQRKLTTKNVECNYHKMSIGLFILFVACFFPFTAHAVTNYVWQSSPSSTSPYTNWSTAAHIIQDAVDVANDGDLVLVTNGAYTTGGGLTPGFSLSNRVVITNAITLQSMNGPTNTLIIGQGPLGSNAVRCAYLTNGAKIIGFTLTNGHTRNDGSWYFNRGGGGAFIYKSFISNSIIILNSGDRGSGLCCINSEIIDCNVSKNNGTGIFCEQNSKIDGCKVSKNSGIGIFCYYDNLLINCNIISNYANNYGGVFLDYGGIISNCTIFGNTASNFGGGMMLYEGGLVINCNIYNNSGIEGAGSYIYHNGQMNDSKISKNFATEYGGGIYFNGGGNVSNCAISENTAGDASISAGRGGGVSFLNGGTVNNSVIKNNMVLSKGDLTEVGQGGGVYCWGGTLNNCLISGNVAGMQASEGGGVYSDIIGGTLNNCTVVDNYVRDTAGGVYGGTMRNCIVENNYNHVEKDNYLDGTFVYSCTTPLPTGEGNISNNPMFEYASTGNYHLAFGSPCINSGTNAYVVGNRDLDGNPRIVGGRVDMGCYEAPIPEPVGIWIIGLLELWIIGKKSICI